MKEKKVAESANIEEEEKPKAAAKKTAKPAAVNAEEKTEGASPAKKKPAAVSAEDKPSKKKAAKSADEENGGGEKAKESMFAVLPSAQQTEGTLIKCLLTHVVFVFALIFAFGKTDKKNSYLRFYSFQVLLVLLVEIAVAAALMIPGALLGLIHPGFVLAFGVLTSLILVAFTVFLVMSMIYSYHNKLLFFPLIGKKCAGKLGL